MNEGPGAKATRVADSVSVPDDVLVREIRGEAVLLNVRTQTYHGLDAVGTRMWRALAETGSVKAAAAELAAAYDAEPERIEADLRSLVADLSARGLLWVAAD